MSSQLNFRQTAVKTVSTVIKSLSIAVVAFSIFFAPASFAAKAESKTEVAQIRVNINTASAEVLSQQLNGVGMKKAAAIVSFRKKNGKFKSLEDLALVKGIGQATVEKNRSKLTL